MSRPVLIIVCGLPGAGKTTHAKSLEQERAAVRFCPDEWMAAIGLNLWDNESRDWIEALQWQLARQLLALGQNVVIEWGTWVRAERDKLRAEATALGAAVELHTLLVPTDMLFDRVRRRGLENPPVTKFQLEHWATLFEQPMPQEMAGYDHAVTLTAPAEMPIDATAKLDKLQAIIRPMLQDRLYHNVDHVVACLAALRRYRYFADDPQAVELALWLHDAVYDPTRPDNEIKSAELGDALLADLGYGADVVAKVHDLILATRHDGDPGTPDGRLIADIDLLILAAPLDAFDRYEQQIRQEYGHVADADFARGRTKVLTRFLERGTLFYVLHDQEAAARQNLRRAIARWQTAAAGQVS